MARTTGNDTVRDLQRVLYRAAKADPARRFHALYDKVHRRDVLERAWDQVRRNRGAHGIDQITIAQLEQQDVDLLLDELARDLKDGTYRPLPARRVFIPKPGRPGERRPLSIPTVRDRIVQAALKIVIEPIFEAGFLPCSFGFRPKKAAHDALQVILDEDRSGRRWVVETDIASCFEAIPHAGLMSAIEKRISDRHVLKLLRALLRAGVMEDGNVRRPVTGTPQGGVISPLLANVYLDRLDREWQARGQGVLCRYCDDLVVMCQSEWQARRALATLREILTELGLAPKEAKTAITHLRTGGGGFDFLGFQHRSVRARNPRFRHVRFLARWPSRQAMQHARDRIRELTRRSRLLLPVEQVVREVNAFLRGWAGYFRYGMSYRQFEQIRDYALTRLALLVGHRRQGSRGHGWQVIAYQSADRLGLISLRGYVVSPRPLRSWRGPNAGGEGRR